MPTDRFHCPNCDKAYAWSRDIAGRRVRCQCGQALRVPGTADGLAVPDGPLISRAPTHAVEEAETYELDLPEGKAAKPRATHAQSMHSGGGGGGGGGKCPACNIVLRPGAVVCLNCGFDQEHGARIRTVVEHDAPEPAGSVGADNAENTEDGPTHVLPLDADERLQRAAARASHNQAAAADMQRHHAFQEKTLPLILIGAGLVLMVLNAFVLSPILHRSPVSASIFADLWGVSDSVSQLVEGGILFLIQLPCLFVGVLVVAKLFGTAFGELFTALRKLAAIALVFGQFTILLNLAFDIYMEGFGFIAYPVKLSLNFIVFWAVSVKMFDEMELSEIVTLWMMLSFLPLMIFVLLITVL